MRRLLSAIRVALAGASMVLAGAGQRAGAQTTEIPVSFDSAHTITELTPALVARLHLGPPGWAVEGDFRTARLYLIRQSGTFMIAAERSNGEIDRYPVTVGQRETLSAAVDAALTADRAARRTTGALSQPVGNAFARRQTLLGLVAYGPLAASLATDGSTGGALYLLVAGGTFFVTYNIAQSQQITSAQNHLASQLALGVGGAGWLYGYAATGESSTGVRAVALGSAITGAAIGFNAGRTLTDAESEGITAGIESGGLLGAAVAGLANSSARGLSAAIGTGLLVGAPVGLLYPRNASYTVTGGDVDAVGTTGLVGALVSGVVLGDNPSQRTAAAVLGTGYVAGLIVGDRAIARPFDLTQSESNIAGIGAVAGGLLGLAIPEALQSDNQRFVVGSAALGAAIGLATIISYSPHRAGVRTANTRSANTRTGSASSHSGPQFDFTPLSFAGVLGKTPGQYSLLHIGF